MKRCPECRRDYYDDSLLYCLDDGSVLVDGPASAGEQKTARFPASMPNPAANLSAEEQRPRSRASADRNLAIPAFLVIAIVTVIGLAGYLTFRQGPNKQFRSIAVMPLMNESDNAEIDYISDGLTEMLITSLSRLPDLDVKPRSSVFRYKGRQMESQSIAEELGVQALLNGRIRHQGQELSLFFELIDISLNKVIWSQQYKRSTADLAQLQAEIGRDVSKELKQKVTDVETRNITRRYTDSPEAYALYLKGRYYWDKRNEEGYRVAIDAYTRAIELDPAYALAYAGLADCYLFRASTIPRREAMPKAREYAQKALALDDSLAEAHTTLAFVQANYDLDMGNAETTFRRAIELDPNYAVAHQFYGTMLVATSRIDEGLSEMRRAVELEPFSAAINWSLGLGLTYARRYDDAVAQQERTLRIQPGYSLAEGNLIGIFILQGKYDDALRRVQDQLQRDPRNEGALTSLAIIYGRTGRQNDARKLLQILEVGADESVGNRAYGIARIYAALGETENTIRWLRKAIDARAFSSMFLRVDPFFDKVSDLPEFRALLTGVYRAN